MLDDSEKQIVKMVVQACVLPSLMRGTDPVQVITAEGLSGPAMAAIKKAGEIADYLVESNLTAS